METSTVAEPEAPTRTSIVKTAADGIRHVEAAYQEIDERIELHLEHFDKLLERMRENYRAQLVHAKNEARAFVESAIERWRDTSGEIMACHETLEQSKNIIGAFSSAVQTGRYNLHDTEPGM